MQVQKRILLEEGIKEKDIGKFQDPKYIATFWRKRSIKDINSLERKINKLKKLRRRKQINTLKRKKYRLVRKLSPPHKKLKEKLSQNKLKDKLSREGDTMEKTLSDKRLYNHDKL